MTDAGIKAYPDPDGSAGLPEGRLVGKAWVLDLVLEPVLGPVLGPLLTEGRVVMIDVMVCVR